MSLPLPPSILSAPSSPLIVSSPSPPVSMSVLALPAIVKASVCALRFIVHGRPYARRRDRLDALDRRIVRPSALSLAEVEVRMIVSISPVASPRLIELPSVPLMMASSWAPVSYVVAGRAGEIDGLDTADRSPGRWSSDMSPLALTLSTSRAAAEIDRGEASPTGRPSSSRCRRRAAGERLDAGDRARW